MGHDRDSYKNYRRFFVCALTAYLVIALGAAAEWDTFRILCKHLLPLMFLVTLFFWKKLIDKSDFSHVGEAINKNSRPTNRKPKRRSAGKLPSSCFSLLLRLKTADEQKDETPN